MESKYYTPEIEEFHQGFEYEVWYSSAYTKEKWIKESFEFYDRSGIYHYEGVDLIHSFKENGDSIRVKYLDEEDIESLGWKFECLVLNNILNFEYKNFELAYETDDKILSIVERHNEKSGTRKFIGIIKNKSELIKLMKQLKINE